MKSVALSAAAALLAGGGLALTAYDPASAADRARAEGALTRWDTTLVPEGATARVQAVQTGSGATVFTLHVRGLLPTRTYGAHVHVRACGTAPGDAGGHYQDTVAPAGMSTSPHFANAANEVWLDLTTDSDGNGSAQTRVEWTTRAGGANSVTVHAAATATADGVAGTAGPRVACLTAPL